MKTQYRFDTKQIENFDLTISITMTVDQWRNVMRIRAQNYHSAHEKLQIAISKALGDFTRATSQTYEYDESSQ